jgi:hypothetical protein
MNSFSPDKLPVFYLSAVYLTTPLMPDSVHSVECRAMKNNWKGYGTQRSCSNLRHCSSMCLEWLRKTSNGSFASFGRRQCETLITVYEGAIKWIFILVTWVEFTTSTLSHLKYILRLSPHSLLYHMFSAWPSTTWLCATGRCKRVVWDTVLHVGHTPRSSCWLFKGLRDRPWTASSCLPGHP